MKNKEKRYSKHFYTKKSIDMAVKDYTKIATINVSDVGEYYVCLFSNCKTSPEITINEFDNYLIEILSLGRTKEET